MVLEKKKKKSLLRTNYKESLLLVVLRHTETNQLSDPLIKFTVQRGDTPVFKVHILHTSCSENDLKRKTHERIVWKVIPFYISVSVQKCYGNLLVLLGEVLGRNRSGNGNYLDTMKLSK